MASSRRTFLKGSGTLFGACLAAPVMLERMFCVFASDVPRSVNRSEAGAPPVFAVEDFSKKFEPAYLSNGLIGIRPGPNPRAKPSLKGGGFVFADVPYARKTLPPAPTPLKTDIRVETKE